MSKYDVLHSNVSKQIEVKPNQRSKQQKFVFFFGCCSWLTSSHFVIAHSFIWLEDNSINFVQLSCNGIQQNIWKEPKWHAPKEWKNCDFFENVALHKPCLPKKNQFWVRMIFYCIGAIFINSINYLLSLPFLLCENKKSLL